MSKVNTLRIAGQRLLHSWRHQPFATGLAVGLPPTSGLLAVIYGDEVSAALGNLAAGVLSRTMGVALLVGGIIVVAGVIGHRALLVTIGLGAMAFGLGLYGAGVILGLGLAGMVAGPVCLIVAAALIRRAITMSQPGPHFNGRS